MQIYRIGSIAFIILGIFHIGAHILGTINPTHEALILMQHMENHKIKLFGEHSLLKFHNGFSLMMGFLFTSFGCQNLMQKENIDIQYLTLTLIVTSLALVVSILHFHIVATGFIGVSLVCYLLAFEKIWKAF